MVDDHLPDVYLRFREDYPAVAGALDGLGEAADGAVTMDERTARLPEHKRPDAGSRGSTCENSGMSYGGRPRNPKKRKRTPQSHYDSFNTWKGTR